MKLFSIYSFSLSECSILACKGMQKQLFNLILNLLCDLDGLGEWWNLNFRRLSRLKPVNLNFTSATEYSIACLYLVIVDIFDLWKQFNRFMCKIISNYFFLLAFHREWRWWRWCQIIHQFDQFVLQTQFGKCIKKIFLFSLYFKRHIHFHKQFQTYAF